MPGKYLEYINAGRFAVPVEIEFLQASITSDLTREEEFSSKWAERSDWKEIKKLLKHGVEECLQYNDKPVDKLPRAPKIHIGHDVGLGYFLIVNKDKSPFFSLLDAKKNSWTDDEDEIDENNGFLNFGGSFKSYTPAKLCLRVAVLKRTYSELEDKKRLQKFMGGKNEDIRQYYAAVETSTIANESSTDLLAAAKDKTGTKHTFLGPVINRGRSLEENTSAREEIIPRSREFRSSIENDDRDFSITKEKLVTPRTNGLGTGRWPMSNRNPSFSSSKNDSFWRNVRNNVDGSYYEEKDEDDEDDSDEGDRLRNLVDDTPTPLFRNSIIDDDDDTFSLPDIPESPFIFRDPEVAERAFLAKEAPKQKQKSPPTFKGSLDFNSRVNANLSSPSKYSKESSTSGSTNNQKRKKSTVEPSSNATAFEEAIASIDLEMRKQRLEEKKLKQKNKSSSPDKSFSPIRKRPSLSPTKSASKIPKTRTRAPREKSLKNPVHYKKRKDKNVQKSAPAQPTPSTSEFSTARRISTSPIRTGIEKSPSRKHKRRRKEVVFSSTSSSDVDPEMPVLQKMVYYTEPTRPFSPIRKPKTEPVAVREEPQPVIPPVPEPVPVPVAPQVQPEVEKPKEPELPPPTEEKSKPKPKMRTLRQKRKRKDEQTQTVPDKLEALPTCEQPTQTIPTSQIIVFNGQAPEPQPGPSRNAHLSLLPPPVDIIPVVSVVDVFPKPGGSIVESTESEDDEDANLFSFEHLSKCSAPNVMPKQGLAGPSRAPTPPSSISTMPILTPEPVMNMMPPVKRPPRTPQKVPRILPTSSAIVPYNSEVIINGGRVNHQTVSRIGVVSSMPSSMSTAQLLSNDNTLLAGLGLLNELASKRLNASQLEVRLGLQEAPRPQRAVSPDICEGPAKKRKPPTEFQQSRFRKTTVRKGTFRSLSDSLEEGDLSGSEQQGGEDLFRELVRRQDLPQFRYEPQDDEYDLSQGSFCMVNLIPQYGEKSRTYKMHCKNISEVTVDALLEHFTTVKPQILDIFSGKLHSDRHQLFLGDHRSKKELKNSYVTVPFTNEHGTNLFNWLVELLVPNQQDRPQWTDYIHQVMLPESFIRIYAYVNDISYKRADTEMRFGAFYDDDSIHQ